MDIRLIAIATVVVLALYFDEPQADDNARFNHYQYGECTVLSGRFQNGTFVFHAICNQGKVYKFYSKVKEVE
jgi:hypothetical protein